MRFPYHGAGIGLVLDGCILLGLRADTPFRNTWCVPGGFMERHENDVLEVAKRELTEETGLVLDRLGGNYVCSWTLKVPFFSWTTYFYILDSFNEAWLKREEKEFLELRWVHFSELRKMHLRPFTKSEVRCLGKCLRIRSRRAQF